MEEKQNGEILKQPDMFVCCSASTQLMLPPNLPLGSLLGAPCVCLTLSEVSLGPGHASENYQPALVTQTTCSMAAIGL